MRNNFSGSISMAIKVEQWFEAELPFRTNSWVMGRRRDTLPPNKVFWLVEHFFNQAMRSCLDRFDAVQPSIVASFCNSDLFKKQPAGENSNSLTIASLWFAMVAEKG